MVPAHMLRASLLHSSVMIDRRDRPIADLMPAPDVVIARRNRPIEDFRDK